VRARRQAGFTALELLASTLILMLVMLIAIQMLGEAGRLLSSAQVELGEPSMELTRQWLRRDVQGASALGGLAFQASSGALELRGHPDGTLVYEKVGRDLERVVLGPSGEQLGRRIVLRRVSLWRWRTLSAGLVEVQIVDARRERPARMSAGGRGVKEELMTERRSFALRGHPRRFW
jgi:hypothetical protein